MSGSMTWRAYTGDDNTVYSIKIDESNARAAIAGGTAAPLCPVRTANSPVLPCGTRKRYVNTYNSALPTQRRKFYIGDPTLVATISAPGTTITAENYPGAGDTAGTNVTWVVSSYRGEKRRIPPAYTATDTGLTDGTAGQ
jgi:hypothetical protein